MYYYQIIGFDRTKDYKRCIIQGEVRPKDDADQRRQAINYFVRDNASWFIPLVVWHIKIK